MKQTRPTGIDAAGLFRHLGKGLRIREKINGEERQRLGWR